MTESEGKGLDAAGVVGFGGVAGDDVGGDNGDVDGVVLLVMLVLCCW